MKETPTDHVRAIWLQICRAQVGPEDFRIVYNEDTCRPVKRSGTGTFVKYREQSCVDYCFEEWGGYELDYTLRACLPDLENAKERAPELFQTDPVIAILRRYQPVLNTCRATYAHRWRDLYTPPEPPEQPQSSMPHGPRIP